MAANSKIEWTDHTWNPIRGCTRISPGCRRCYAETLSKRNPATLGEWGPFGRRSLAAESYWRQLRQWNAEAEQARRRASVFVASLADMGEGTAGVDRVEYDARMSAALAIGTDAAITEVDEWAALFEDTSGPRESHVAALDRMAAETADLRWLPILLLTKRPWNIQRWAERRGEWPATWALGVTIEEQRQLADRWRYYAMCIPAPMRFWSVEPQVGPLSPAQYLTLVRDRMDGSWQPMHTEAAAYVRRRGLLPDWIIQGGESGGGARPLHPGWARELRDQAKAAGVPYLFKQWGEWGPMSVSEFVTEAIGGRNLQECIEIDRWSSEGVNHGMFRVGKKAAGRVLDGVTHDGRPAFLTDREPIRGAA